MSPVVVLWVDEVSCRRDARHAVAAYRFRCIDGTQHGERNDFGGHRAEHGHVAAALTRAGGERKDRVAVVPRVGGVDAASEPVVRHLRKLVRLGLGQQRVGRDDGQGRCARRQERCGTLSAQDGLRRAEQRAPVGTARTGDDAPAGRRSEEHTSELQSPIDISYAVFCLKKKKKKKKTTKSARNSNKTKKT